MSKRRIAQVNNTGFEQENFIVSSKLEFYKRENKKKNSGLECRVGLSLVQ